jgi:hypothetical protein
MTLQSLLVSKDDYSAEVLSRALANFAIAVERFSELEIALHRLGEQRCFRWQLSRSRLRSSASPC